MTLRPNRTVYCHAWLACGIITVHIKPVKIACLICVTHYGIAHVQYPPAVLYAVKTRPVVVKMRGERTVKLRSFEMATFEAHYVQSASVSQGMAQNA